MPGTDSIQRIKTDMAEEIARLEERLRSVETRQLKSQHSIYSADVEQEELIFEVHQLYSWLEVVSVEGAGSDG